MAQAAEANSPHPARRYQSGFFWRHPLVEPYEFYWRIDSPTVRFYCDLDYDPCASGSEVKTFSWQSLTTLARAVLYMKENNKKYGFTITIKEYEATIPTLWDETKKLAVTPPHPSHRSRH